MLLACSTLDSPGIVLADGRIKVGDLSIPVEKKPHRGLGRLVERLTGHSVKFVETAGLGAPLTELLPDELGGAVPDGVLLLLRNEKCSTVTTQEYEIPDGMTELGHGTWEHCPVILLMGKPGDRILVRGESVTTYMAAANPVCAVIPPSIDPFGYTLEVQPDCSVRKLI